MAKTASKPKKKKKKKQKQCYDCVACPAYCCSYDEIPVKKADVKRLAYGFGISAAKAEKKFTTKGENGDRIMRHQDDEYFGTACMHLDQETRNCTIYEHRPKICREFPDTKRCGYWDFMMWERENQDDDEFVPEVL